MAAGFDFKEGGKERKRQSNSLVIIGTFYLYVEGIDGVSIDRRKDELGSIQAFAKLTEKCRYSTLQCVDAERHRGEDVPSGGEEVWCVCILMPYK